MWPLCSQRPICVQVMVTKANEWTLKSRVTDPEQTQMMMTCMPSARSVYGDDHHDYQDRWLSEKRGTDAHYVQQPDQGRQCSEGTGKSIITLKINRLLSRPCLSVFRERLLPPSHPTTISLLCLSHVVEGGSYPLSSQIRDPGIYKSERALATGSFEPLPRPGKHYDFALVVTRLRVTNKVLFPTVCILLDSLDFHRDGNSGRVHHGVLIRNSIWRSMIIANSGTINLYYTWWSISPGSSRALIIVVPGTRKCEP